MRYSFEDELTETLRLIRRYNDTPMSFADACLVRVVEKAITQWYSPRTAIFALIEETGGR